MKHWSFELKCGAITIAVALLGLFGILTVFAVQNTGLALHQAACLVLALTVMYFAGKIPFDVYRKYTFPGVILSILLLAGLPFFGVKINGMSGWYRIGGISIQISEFAKIFLLLGLAEISGGNEKEYLRAAKVFMMVLVFAVLLLLQPDLGTLLVYLAALFAVLLLGNFHWRYIAALPAVLIPAAGWVLWHYPHAWRRLTAFLDPGADPTGSGWHILQFQLTVSRGGWFGMKTPEAVWNYAYLPLAYNDSAFAAMLECLGLIGALVPVSLYILLFAALGMLSDEPALTAQRRLFIRLAAAVLAIQVLLHISVNLALIPPTGLNLPFFSCGGSSLISGALLLGCALSAAHFPDKKS